MSAENDLEQPLIANNDKLKESFISEAYSIVILAVGFFFTRLSWISIKITDTALIGHTGTSFLEAASISDLYTSCTGSFVYGGALNTFVAQARGAGNYRLAGIWLNVSVLCLTIITGFVMLSWFFTEQVVSLFGVTPDIAKNAGYYSRVLLLCLPARMWVGQIAKFFAANEKPYPQVNIMTFAAIFNLVFGLILVVGFPFKSFDGFGFKACPIVTTATEWISLLLFVIVYCYWQGMHRQFGWKSFDMKEITYPRLRSYLTIFVPQALSTMSDFLRVSVIGVFAGTLSELDIAVFNTGYRVMWLGLTLVGSIGSAVSVKLGKELGAGSEDGAKRVLKSGYFLVAAVEGFLIAMLLLFVRQLSQVFSSDEEVVQRFVDVKMPLSVMLIFMSFSVYLESLVAGTGRTREIFLIGVFGSWACQVPLSFLFINYVDNSLNALYWGVALGYFITCLGLVWLLASSSWQQLIDEAKLRSEVKN